MLSKKVDRPVLGRAKRHSRAIGYGKLVMQQKVWMDKIKKVNIYDNKSISIN